MLSELTLLSGIDIPLTSAQVNIHQPTLKEIAYIGEETFFIGCELLNFSKNSLPSEDKDNLQSYSDFDIIMSIMRDKSNPSTMRSSISAQMVLSLLFPVYTVRVQTDCISLKKRVFEDAIVDNKVQKVPKIEEHKLDNSNYSDFKEILVQIFSLKKNENQQYNPQGKLANKIADKLRQGAQKRAALQGQQEKIAVLSRYASILTVGLGIDTNQLMQHTVYQLFDEFQRFELKLNYDIYLQAKMAGAKDLEDVDNWTKDLYDDSSDKDTSLELN